LGISEAKVKQVWTEFERRILDLAKASYVLAWLRAYGISHHLLNMFEEE
ncbi:DUF1289 domain-containing protein, partial [Acinetobacter baumannii]